MRSVGGADGMWFSCGGVSVLALQKSRSVQVLSGSRFGRWLGIYAGGRTGAMGVEEYGGEGRNG